MNPTEALSYIQGVIENEYRHPLYADALKFVETANIIHAQDSKEQAKQIERYRPGEHYMLKERRVELDNPITSPALAPVYSVRKNFYRVDGIKKNVVCENAKVKARLDDNFSAFYGREDLHEYLFNTIGYLNETDPNAWLVVEHTKTFNNENLVEDVQIFPLEVSSKQAIDFGFDKNRNAKYLTVLRKWKVKDKKGKDKEYEEYFMYNKGFSFHLVEILPDYTHTEDYSGYEIKAYTRNKKTIEFYFRSFAYQDQTRVPAMPVGAYPSMLHNRELFELFVQAAVPLLNDLIMLKNLINVSFVTHAFPERSEYIRRCRHVNQQGECCDGTGYYAGIRDGEHLCKSCQGTGKDRVMSEMRVKELVWEKDMAPADMIELSKLVHYVDRPIDLLKFLEEKMESSIGFVYRVVFNQEAFAKESFSAETATSIRVNYDRQYDKLMPYGEVISNFWELFWVCGMEYYGVTNGDAEMTYPLDPKLIPLNDLIILYAGAKSAGLPYQVLQSIEMDVLRKTYRASPDLVAEIEALNKWKPFKDKTSEEAVSILTGRADDDFDRLVWENFDALQNWIISEYQGNFHKITDYKAQLTVIEEGVKVISDRIKTIENALLEPTLNFEDAQLEEENAMNNGQN